MFTQIAQQQMPEPIPTSEFIKFVGSYLLVAYCILIIIMVIFKCYFSGELIALT